MKAVVQRVSEASVSVDGEKISGICNGLLVLLGVAQDDCEKQADWIAKKLTTLRIFSDESEKLALDVNEVDGSILLVSQFTLLGELDKGTRPSFSNAADRRLAEQLYERVAQQLRGYGVNTEIGVFGTKMDVALNNNGPVTILLER